MLASIHIADVSPRELAVALLRRRDTAQPGLIYGRTLLTAPLGPGLLPAPSLRRLAFAGFWSGPEAVDRFIDSDPLGARLGEGWHIRLQPTHVFGRWPALDGALGEPLEMSPREPAAVLTIGRLRLAATARFLRASADAERLALADEALAASSGLALPPRLVATFSLWRTTEAMRRYADGSAGPEHRAASLEQRSRPFHHDAAFIRFRPLSAHGSLAGWESAAELIGGGVAATA